MKRYMSIKLYPVDQYGERMSETYTLDYLVTKIEIEEDHYKITTAKDVRTFEEVTYNVPTDKYEIVINKFN